VVICVSESSADEVVDESESLPFGHVSACKFYQYASSECLFALGVSKCVMGRSIVGAIVVFEGTYDVTRDRRWNP
jgi:hypothetical protein